MIPRKLLSKLRVFLPLQSTNFVTMQKLFGFITALLLTLQLTAQSIDYTFRFTGIGDNREYFSGYNVPQTILGARGAFILGTKLDSINRFRAGIDYFYEFGSVFGELKPKLILYYEANKGPWMFRMGSFTRSDVLNYPLAIIADDYDYYKPNLEGLYIRYKKQNWKMDVFADWVSRQDSVRREQFMAGLTLNAHWGRFLTEDYWYMFHNASSLVKVENDHIKDYMGAIMMVGFDFSGIIPLDIATVKSGVLTSLWRDRGNGLNYILKNSSYSEIVLEEKGFGIKTIINVGEKHNFNIGDSFYNNTTSYIRAGLYFTPINFKNVKGRFTWTFHFAKDNTSTDSKKSNWDLDNQQQFSLIYFFNKTL
jgi:hypothetical protein